MRARAISGFSGQTVHRAGMPLDSRYREKGFVLSEYLIVSIVLVGLLFVPVPGLGLSVVDLVLDALAAYKSSSLKLLSMP